MKSFYDHIMTGGGVPYFMNSSAVATGLEAFAIFVLTATTFTTLTAWTGSSVGTSVNLLASTYSNLSGVAAKAGAWIKAPHGGYISAITQATGGQCEVISLSAEHKAGS